MKARIEKLSAITLKVTDMEASVLFYRDVLGMELLYGGPNAGFSSLRIPGTEFPIINLQQGRATAGWGRMILHVADVDAFWTHLKEKGFEPDTPQNASWGERYFHLHDPDGHELSFARLLSPNA
jgi:catechol 2,3-dioxygenase-like lactoylglutathione lyase family enzyme